MAAMILGIGAKATANDWLFNMLDLCDEIDFPHGRSSGFWTQYDENMLDRYLLRYPQLARRDNAEICSGYALLPERRVKEISVIYPTLRIIYILRHPVTRTCAHISRHCSRLPLPPSDIPLEAMVALMKCKKYLQHNDYMANYKRWARHTKPHQLLLLGYDDIVKRPAYVIEMLADFLGFDKYYHSKLTRAQLRVDIDRRVNIVPKRVQVEMAELYEKMGLIENMNRVMGREVKMI